MPDRRETATASNEALFREVNERRAGEDLWVESRLRARQMRNS